MRRAVARPGWRTAPGMPGPYGEGARPCQRMPARTLNGWRIRAAVQAGRPMAAPRRHCRPGNYRCASAGWLRIMFPGAFIPSPPIPIPIPIPEPIPEPIPDSLDIACIISCMRAM
ncbi:protein of unknown function (plasmid) [Cupriavidus neocaledonicus]|uniref:Uncharacterized protein n=1 Tax=Cupriavidus neocaledonicus TaxID=1040979 RepID=A0A375HSQ3_9BURK|nr:protein of unknown function [Cupriavidus neocaledonicus]